MRPSRSEIESGKSLLRGTGWLAACPPAFREAVLAESSWLKAEPDMAFARGGDTTGGVFGVASGSIGVIPATSAPDAGLIHIDRAPFWFGLSPFLTGVPRQVTVLARDQCIVAHVSQAGLSKILGDHPDGWRLLLMQTDAIARLAIQSVADLLLPSPERRCAAVLLRLAGARNPELPAHDIFCSHDELAAMCNLSRSSVSIVLKKLRRLGAIELGYRCIKVHDPQKLRDVVDAC